MNKQEYKRILLVRTDRLGDVILATPAIKAIRQAYPNAYVAMVTAPHTEAALKGNPYLDKVIVYDKHIRHRSLLGNLRFVKELKGKNFDIAIIFHPTNRMHILTYLAKIPVRIGYDKKFPFLLTERIKDTKHEGKKHERDYVLDMLKTLNIEPQDRQLYLAVSDIDLEFIDRLFLSHGIRKKDVVVTIHPGASCASKIWPSERFAKLADRLIERYGAKIIVVGGEDKKAVFCVNSVRKFMQKEAVFLAGALNVGQLAALLKKSALFISNDSGPVHVAEAIGAPVVVLFGRNQPGLSAMRWGPLGPKDVIIHKDVGCKGICLAHDCKKSFECLTSISVEEVLSAIEKMGVIN